MIPDAVVDAARRRCWTKFNEGADRAGLPMRAIQLAMIFDRLAGPGAEEEAPPAAMPAVVFSA